MSDSSDLLKANREGWRASQEHVAVLMLERERLEARVVAVEEAAREALDLMGDDYVSLDRSEWTAQDLAADALRRVLGDPGENPGECSYCGCRFRKASDEAGHLCVAKQAAFGDSGRRDLGPERATVHDDGSLSPMEDDGASGGTER